MGRTEGSGRPSAYIIVLGDRQILTNFCSNMGIIDAVKNLKRYPDAEEEIKELMKKLLEFEENNIQQLKKFL
jgi:hypothetical protein